MSRIVVAFAALFVVCTSISDARTRRELPALEWGLKLGVTGIYNDNLLRLSETDLNAFHRFDPRFRTPVETTDDGETEISLTPSVLWRAPAVTMVNIQYRFKAVQRAKNDHTNYQTHSMSASVRPRVKGYRWVVRAGVFTIPSFYLRVYRDRDFGTYDDARFTNWEYNGELSYRVSEPLWLSLQGGTGTYYYNARFTEYDSDYDEFGAEVEYATPWDPRISMRYTRRISDNIGSTQGSSLEIISDPGAIEDSEYGDGDFDEDDFRIALRTPVKIVKSEVVDASVAARVRRRVYTTDRSIESDPFHRGRLDNRWEVTPSLSWSPHAALDIALYYTYEERASESDVEAVALVKDFVRREIGLGFTYRIN